VGRLILCACLVAGLAGVVAADTGYDLKGEIAWARRTWHSDLKGIRFGTPTKKLLAWVPAGGSIVAWAHSPSHHHCDRIELRRISGEPAAVYGDQLLVGESIVDQGFSQGREYRAWKAFSFGDVFEEGGESLRGEERDADGTWHPAGQTGTIGRENATYGVLTYVDANVARFGGTRLALYAACARRGCKKVTVFPEEMDVHFDGGFPAYPPVPSDPAVTRLDALQSHVTVWQPSGESPADTPSLHRTLAGCMRTHYPGADGGRR
jgi:hypothetical protein